MKTSIVAKETAVANELLESDDLKCSGLYEIHFRSGKATGEYLCVDFIGKRILITVTGELMGGENIKGQYQYKRSTKVLTLNIQN